MDKPGEARRRPRDTLAGTASRSGPRAINRTIRPKGGTPDDSRNEEVLARQSRRNRDARRWIAGLSGDDVCTSTRPRAVASAGSTRDLRDQSERAAPAAHESREDEARYRRRSPLRASHWKSRPFAIICVPSRISTLPSRKAVNVSFMAPLTAHRVGIHPTNGSIREDFADDSFQAPVPIPP